MLINIDPSTKDSHYRYKMPKLEITIKKSKTYLINILEISQSLKRSPKTITKFIAQELGTQFQIESNQYILNGKHDLNTIEKILFNFIDQLVLCHKCRSPETYFLKGKKLKRECLACGYKSLDENLKIGSFILKNIENEYSKNDSIYSISGSFEYLNEMDEKENLSSSINKENSNISIDNENNIFNKFNGKNFEIFESDHFKDLKKFFENFEFWVIKNEIFEFKDYFDSFIDNKFLSKNDIYNYFKKPSKILNKNDNEKVREGVFKYLDEF